MSYLMESPREAERLRAQARATPARERLQRCGLRHGMRAVDVGCGSGAVTRELVDLVGPSGQVVALDPSPERLGAARELLWGLPGVELMAGALPDTKLPAASFDFVWSQFVLEYLREPAAAVRELVRLARPGGRVAVAEIDGFGLATWPTPPAVEQGTRPFLEALASTGFDLNVGRKLFTLFRQAGLREVKVHLSSFHVTAGAADAQLLDDWRTRFEALAPVARPAFGGGRAYDEFCAAYLALLADPDALKYSVILTTEGTR